jgi:hypothetical protein
MVRLMGRFPCWLVAVLFALLFCRSANAASFSIFQRADLNPNCNLSFGSPNPIDFTRVCTDTNGVPFGPTFTTNTTFKSRADLISIGAYLDYNVSWDVSFFSTSVGAVSSVLVMDSLTVSGGTGNGFLHLVFTVNGTGTAQSPLAPDARLSIFSNIGHISSLYGSGVLVVDLPFVYGTPVFLQREFTIGLYGGGGTSSSGTGGLLDYYGSADLSLSVLDQNMQSVNGATVTSDTGYVYATATAVPEPNTALLLFTGLVSLSLCLYTKTVQRRKCD